MKIALVCPYNMFQRTGGVQEFLWKLAENLRERGHTVKIITPKPLRYKGEAPENVIFLGTSRRINYRPLATTADVSMEIDGDEIHDLLEREQFDVINYHEPWVPIIHRQIITRSNAINVGTWHSSMYETRTHKAIVSLLTPYGRTIIELMHARTAVSPAAAETILNKSDMSVTFLPNAIDLNEYKPVENPKPLSGKGTKTIVYVGRLERRKCPEQLLKAFRLLVEDDPSLHLIMAGKGPLLSRLEQVVDEYEIPNVKFTGFVDNDEKRRLIGNADLFCSPAMFGESFGIVLLESMAMGVPTVAGNNRGYRCVLTDTGRLSLIDADATEDFALRMRLMLDDEKLRKIWREWALKTVKQYDFKVVARLYEKTYKEALLEYDFANR